MERKLERCIRLRFVSLCTCVCTRVFMSMCERSVCFGGNEKNQQNIDQPLKIINIVFVFNTSLGAFARWKAPSIPRCGRRRRRRRENVKNATAASVAAMVAAFTVAGAFAAFVLCFCFRSVCVLLASWWYKLSMRLFVVFGVPEDFPNQNKGKPKRVSIGAHSVVELSLCACFEPNVLFSEVHNFPLLIFSFRRMCMCRISPFFRRNRPAFPSFSLYWIDFWALPLYWYWFQRLPNKLPKLVFRWPHGISRPSHVLARAFSLFHVGKCVTCAPLQPILSMMCVCPKGVFASWFFKVVQKSPKSETRVPI